MNVLVIAAHPDDEVLGCGATACRLADEGNGVHIAIFSEGSTSRWQSRNAAPDEPVEQLVHEARTAKDLLGAVSLHMLGLPDNRFDTIPLLDLAKEVEKLVQSIQPTTIFTHHPGDLNIDHRLLCQATLTACRPTSNHPVRELLAFEIPSSTEWAFQHIEPTFRPNTFYDVSTTLDRKLEAMEAYASEMRPYPHPRSLKALTAYAQRWGSVVGIEAAEAFESIRLIR